jgi:hypothetical protein
MTRHCPDSAGALPAQPSGPPCRGSEPFLLPDISRLSTHSMLRLRANRACCMRTALEQPLPTGRTTTSRLTAHRTSVLSPGLVQRTGCSACGLGHPHQVWWAPPMYVHSLCLAPVSFAGMSTYLGTSACSPPGLSHQFLPTAGLYKNQPKKSGSPTPTGSRRPRSFV